MRKTEEMRREERRGEEKRSEEKNKVWWCLKGREERRK
jgi:hypothetical protein